MKHIIRQYILGNLLFTDDESGLQDSESFLDGGIIDSTGVMEIILFIEETFGIKVTDDEMTTIRTHPFQGYKILKETNQLTEECMVIVMQHHEREDGSGYPRKLKGDEIHTYGRICCIADVYDALTAQRSYQEPRTTFDALKLMKEKLLNHFQQDMFEKFVMLFTNR